MSKTYNLPAYTAFKSLNPLQTMNIIKAAKEESKREIKGVAALDQACFKYFLKNIYGKN
jgi:hypothetical protein